MQELRTRHSLALGREILAHFPCLVLQGARQSGKSTLAQLLTSDRPALHLNFDDSDTRAAFQEDPRGFVEQTEDTLVIDEAQRVPELLLAIKASIDRNKQPGRYILTGSANLLRVKGMEDSLAGRMVDLVVRPFTQGEIQSHCDDFVSAVVDGKVDPPAFNSSWSRPDYISALEKGGYPELQEISPRLRQQWLNAYLARLLQHDIRDVPNGTNTARLSATLRLLADNQSGELVKTHLAKEAGYGETLVQGYLDALEAVYLIDQLRPWTGNLTSREVGRRKIVVADSAVAMHLTGSTTQSLLPLTAKQIGPLFEGFVASQLLAQQTWSMQMYSLYHYRDRGGVEVDLIVELADGRIIGIEVKTSSTYKPEYFKGLKFLRDRLGERFVGGFVLGMSQHGFRFADKLWGLPAAALWQL